MTETPTFLAHIPGCLGEMPLPPPPPRWALDDPGVIYDWDLEEAVILWGGYEYPVDLTPFKHPQHGLQSLMEMVLHISLKGGPRWQDGMTLERLMSFMATVAERYHSIKA